MVLIPGGGGDLSFNTIYTFTITPYNILDISGNKQTINIDTTPKVAGNIATNSTASNTQLQWKWCGNSPFSYVNISRQITAPYTTNYEDVSKNISTTNPYYDIDLSGNTTYSYKITPYTAGDISYYDSTLTYTSNVQAARDLSAIFDGSSIKINYTIPKNSYNTSCSYQLDISYADMSYNIKYISSTYVPPIYTLVPQGSIYNCYISTYLDSVLATKSTVLNIRNSYKYNIVSASNLLFYLPLQNNYLNYASGSGVSLTDNSNTTIFSTNSNNGVFSSASLSVNKTLYYATVPSTAFTTNITVSFWLYVNDASFSTHPIFTLYTPPNSTSTYLSLQYIGSKRVQIFSNFSQKQLQFSSTSDIYNNWIHYCIVITSSGPTIYVNNSTSLYTVGTNNFSTNVSTSASFTSLTFDCANDFYLTGKFFISHFRYYNTNLSTTDITTLYNNKV